MRTDAQVSATIRALVYDYASRGLTARIPPLLEQVRARGFAYCVTCKLWSQRPCACHAPQGAASPSKAD